MINLVLAIALLLDPTPKLDASAKAQATAVPTKAVADQSAGAVLAGGAVTLG